MQIRKLNIKNALLWASTLSFMVLVLAQPSLSMRGVKNGLLICAENIIPALFPFCVFSSFFIKSGLCRKFGNSFSFISEKVFALPKASAGAVFMSLIGGFPLGAIMSESLYERGEITRLQYKRMMLFCVNAGPAFVIGGVGSGMLGSRKAGFIIFLSLTLGSITVAFLSRFLYRDKSCEIKKAENTAYVNISDALSESVSSAVKSVVSVCAWVVLFSCLLELISIFNFKGSLYDFIVAFLEVTRGCKTVVKYKNIPLIVFILGWAGLSVHFQIMKYINESGLDILQFACARLISAGLSSLYCHYILRLFPLSDNVFGSIVNPVPKPFYVSLASGVSMLIMGITLILELDTKHKKC